MHDINRFIWIQSFKSSFNWLAWWEEGRKDNQRRKPPPLPPSQTFETALQDPWEQEGGKNGKRKDEDSSGTWRADCFSWPTSWTRLKLLPSNTFIPHQTPSIFCCFAESIFDPWIGSSLDKRKKWCSIIQFSLRHKLNQLEMLNIHIILYTYTYIIVKKTC